MQPVTVAEIVLHTELEDRFVIVPDGISALPYRHTEDIQFWQYLSDLINLIDCCCLHQFSIDGELQK